MKDSDNSNRLLPNSGNTMVQDGLSETREALARAAKMSLAGSRWHGWRPVADLVVVICFILAMIVLLIQPDGEMVPRPSVDTVAQDTIRAGRDVLLEDESATKSRREEAKAAVSEVFDYNSDLYFSLGDKVLLALVNMKKAQQNNVLSQADRRLAFQKEIGVAVNSGVFALIDGLDDPADAALAINFFLNIGLDRYVIADRSLLPVGRGLEIWDLGLNLGIQRGDTGGIIDLRQLRRLMTARAGDAPYGDARIVRSWILQVAQELAQPNLNLNKSATQNRRQEAILSVKPVFLRIKAGEVLVRRGDRVTTAAWRRIGILNSHVGGQPIWHEMVAMAALLGAILILGVLFFSRFRIPFGFNRKSSYLTLAIVVTTTLISVAMFYFGQGLAEGMDFDPDTAAYFVPLSLATVLVTVLVDSRKALLVGVALSLLISYRVNGDIWLVYIHLAGILASGIAARHSRRRIDLLRIGLIVALVQAAMVPITVTLAGLTFNVEHLPMLLAAMVSGLLVGIATLGLLPAFEWLFDETTETRLLELASADNPILKKLALEAPGTYYHSTMVANLAEAGAEALGANGLMCRVMALYHDIGKLQRPAYFAENQRGSNNIHERLAPEISARVIMHHVLDGLEMARREKLGRVIVEGIAQHQGTTLLRSFYEKAKAQGYNGPELDFRYPGPRPLRRETGILLLADSVEAATRALKDPTSEMVASRVRQVIQMRVSEGELDDCKLTLKDLAEIQETFTRTLTLGVYHNRIDYPPALNPNRLPSGGQGINGTNPDADEDNRIHTLPGVVDRPA